MSPKKPLDLKTVDRELFTDPTVREHWERTVVGRAVALRLVAYRAEHGLSQTALARKLGMKQPAVARLEAGDRNPSLETLARIAETLGIEFSIDICSGKRKLTKTKDREPDRVVEDGHFGKTTVTVSVR